MPRLCKFLCLSLCLLPRSRHAACALRACVLEAAPGCLPAFMQWLEMEQSRDRKDDMSEMEDPRVDICIFTIPPHR